MRFLNLLLCMVVLGAAAQTKKVTESVVVNGQLNLDLEFTFADDITFKSWDKKEVMVEVSVNIQDGKYNDIFTLESRTTSSTISIAMDKDMWDKIDRKDRNGNCSWSTELSYTVYAPKNMEIAANTISGDYLLTYAGATMKLKTISGEIDLTVPSKHGLDFKAKTISGAVYSDIEIEYPHGKDGLRQIVGQNVRGRIGSGGDESKFETISGNIYLRKG
ncbi:MAG: DUF4097 domain-containing protein [Cytophagales bacterium]|nr:DUF4097 domain-containing protein [Cytophagales bacterium]